MVGAPRKNRALEQEPDSDGEAPEQVSLSAGREDAQKLRREERGNQRRVQAEAKKRRQRQRLDRESQAQPQELPEERESIPHAELPEAHAIAQEEATADFSKSARNRGFLDASVVDLLSSKEKIVITSSKLPQADDEAKEKRTNKRKKVKPLELTTSGIKTVVLDADRPSLAIVENAFQFKRHRLFGRRVHRSSDILRKF